VRDGKEAGGAIYRELKAIRAEKNRRWGSPAKAVLGAGQNPGRRATGRLELGGGGE
jgi:hypothetical protein